MKSIKNIVLVSLVSAIISAVPQQAHAEGHPLRMLKFYAVAPLLQGIVGTCRTYHHYNKWHNLTTKEATIESLLLQLGALRVKPRNEEAIAKINTIIKDLDNPLIFNPRWERYVQKSADQNITPKALVADVNEASQYLNVYKTELSKYTSTESVNMWTSGAMALTSLAAASWLWYSYKNY